MTNPHSKCCAMIFGMIIARSKYCANRTQNYEKFCQNFLTIFLEFFSCNLKNRWYNVDIRSKRERKKEKKKNGKEY